MEKSVQFHSKDKKNCGVCLNCVQNQNHSFEEFCESTSIHGMKQLGDSTKGIAERLWWCAIVIISCCFCFKLIWSSYKKWENYPIVTTFARSEANIWNIPFPAVTICPEVKTEREVFNYTDAHLKVLENVPLTEEERKYYDPLSLICLGQSNATVFENRQAVYDNLAEMAPVSTILDMIRIWGEYGRRDEIFFTPVITREGICYTFNILDRNDIFYYPICCSNGFGQVKRKSQWTMEDGYNDANDYKISLEDHSKTDSNSTSYDGNDYEKVYDETYPLRTWNAGVNGGILIMLGTSRTNLEYACNSFVQGYKVALHNPGEIPRIQEQFIRVPLEECVTAAIKPKLITTSKTLKDYDPDVKECFFQKDKSLSLYKIYTLDNCVHECLANATETVCGCIEFYIPGRNSTPICGSGNMDCVLQVSDYVLHGKPITIKRNVNVDVCECRPSCISLDYDVELSQAKVDLKEITKVLLASKKYTANSAAYLSEQEYSISFLELYMKKEQLMTLERHELYESTDFWANCGGLLGLCMGVSIFSILEIVYFCALRLFCFWKKSDRRQTGRDPHELRECKVAN